MTDNEPYRSPGTGVIMNVLCIPSKSGQTLLSSTRTLYSPLGGGSTGRPPLGLLEALVSKLQIWSTSNQNASVGNLCSPKEDTLETLAVDVRTLPTIPGL